MITRFGPLLILALAVAAPAAAAGTDSHYLSEADGAQLAANIRARGYFCEKAVALRRTVVDQAGAKHYRVDCGPSGPFYEVTVKPDKSQAIRPTGAR